MWPVTPNIINNYWFSGLSFSSIENDIVVNARECGFECVEMHYSTI